ncbi:hypothetical protein QYF36_012990 [Acer negundo]|nr:hypothetical protein QYF36_012990 [Acer negundo]
MANKRDSTVKKKEEKLNQIDNIPNYTKQSRSPPPKRRTDFSPFFSSNSGSLLGLSCGRDGLSAISSSDDGKDEGEKLHEPPLVLCCKSWGNGSGLLSKRFDIPIMEVESVAQSALADYNCDRNVGKDTNDNVGMLTFTPSKSQVTGRIGVCITPGNVVWAKTARQTWWPAEIIEERSTSADSTNQEVDGHVLVQYYGIHQSAWVDPARDLSALEDCFEERSCNSMEDFQYALKQALSQRKEHISSCQKSESPEGSNHPDQQDQLSDKGTSSISQGTGSDLPEIGRCKRERKPKVRFDEVTFPQKSTRKDRRLKIMRYLGLIAPIELQKWRKKKDDQSSKFILYVFFDQQSKI